MALKDRIWVALRGVRLPDSARDMVGAGLVQQVAACGDSVTVTLAGVASDAQQAIRDAVTSAVSALADAPAVRVEFAQRSAVTQRAPDGRVRPDTIRTVLAVGSGKGGVGKSTVAVNIAVTLAREGLAVGLMDADAYGPNVPRMLGVTQLPPPVDGLVTPAEAFGVRVVSAGFFVKPEVPLIWRGPKTDTFVRQLLADVRWGPLDVLVVDLPPGTGDIAISLARHGMPEGAVVVATPQSVAVDDARKAIAMFRRLDVPVLGLVENMSDFRCETCGTEHRLFGRGGGVRLAEEAGIPFLGGVPFEPDVCEGGDLGMPAVLRADSRAGAALITIAGELRRHIRKEDTMTVKTVLDVRQVPPRERHPLILGTFGDLTPGEAFVLVNDHDPKPLYYQFQFEKAGQFTWEYQEEGPEVWRVQIGRTTNGK